MKRKGKGRHKELHDSKKRQKEWERREQLLAEAERRRKKVEPR
jgi:hypothetical protein